MSSLEKKREDFRKYLENDGAMDNLTKALIKLYEQKNKPQDATKFLRKEMCEKCHDEEDYELLAADLDEANKKICELERELAKIKGSIKRSASEVDLALTKGFDELTVDAAADESVLKRFLTKEIFDELKGLKTEFKGTLLDCIQAGFDNFTSFGIFACDADAYKVFARFFDPLIEHLHNFKADDKQPDVDFGESCKLPDFDQKYVKNIQISCIRNISGFPFASIMTVEQYEEVMKKLANAVKCLCSSDIKGKFYPYEAMNEDIRRSLIDKQIYFKNDNEELKAANAARFWPTGRAIYASNAKNFYVLCNQQDHFKFIARDGYGNLRNAYELLISGVNQICKDIEIARDERLGFLTFSATNLGNTIRASIQMEFDNISKYRSEFDEIACNFNLKIVKIYDDINECDELYEISNEMCMGMSEFETVKELADGITALIDVDKSLLPKLSSAM